MKTKTQAHRAHCWRTSRVAEGSQQTKGKMDTLASIKMYSFCSPRPTTERMKRFCSSNRGHKELLQMDVKRTDSPVAATRDLSKRLGKQLFKWLMNYHYGNSEKKKKKRAREKESKPGQQDGSIRTHVSQLGCLCVSPAGWPKARLTHPTPLFPDLSILPHGHILVVAQTQAEPACPSVAEHLDERCWVHSVDPKWL